MAESQTFRAAFNGFNREDVVRYIEYLNNKHNTQVNQLRGEIQALQEQLRERPEPQPAADTTEQLAALEARCARLERELAEANRRAAEAVPCQESDTREELEAYRRAERVERLAGERVKAMYAQAGGTLDEAKTMVQETASRIQQVARQTLEQVQALETAVSGSAEALERTVEALEAARPAEEA